jgi:hypothetical protein
MFNQSLILSKGNSNFIYGYSLKFQSILSIVNKFQRLFSRSLFGMHINQVPSFVLENSLYNKHSFNLMPVRHYVDPISLQKIIAISSGNLQFKRAHVLSVFTNRRMFILTGRSSSEEEAKLIADFWYQRWRREQKDKNIAVKILNKSYVFTFRSGRFYCEVRVKYAFKILRQVK